MKKRIISFIVTISLLVAMIPMTTVRANAAKLTLEQLQQKFPEGYYWNHYVSKWSECSNYLDNVWDESFADTITSSPCTVHSTSEDYQSFVGNYDCNFFDGAWQCEGFARKLGYDSTGTRVSSWGQTTISNLKPGDVIHYKGNGADPYWGHWVFVTAVSGSVITVGECNNSYTCDIRWGRSFDLNWTSSYTIYSAPSQLQIGPHTCNKGEFMYYWASHPHYNCYKCSICGTVWEDRTETNVYPACDICNSDTHTCDKGEFVFYWAAHPHYNCYKCSVCGTVWDDKSETNVVQSCADCTSSLYSKIENGYYYLKNNSTNQYMCLSYGIDAQAQNIDMLDFNGSDAMLFDFAADANIGGYSLRPLSCESRVVNVYAETVESGKNVCIYDNVDDGTQRWYFEKVSGGYVIRNVQNPNCVLDIQDGWNVYVSAYTGAASQVWSIETTVTYDANGGTDAPSMQKKNYGETLTLSSAVPQKNGYSFCGWSTDKNATIATYNVGGQFVDNANTTLYAVWSTNTYTISYDANGGDVAPTSQTKIHNSDILLNSDIPIRNGYKFIGWSDNSNSSEVKYKPGDMYTTNSDLTLYAVWEAEVYSIVYDANGGINAPAATSIRYGESLRISEIVPVKDKYDFAGWTTDLNDVNAPTYYAGDVFTVDGDTVLYAKWAEIRYRIDGVIRTIGDNDANIRVELVNNSTGEVRSCFDDLSPSAPFMIYGIELGSSYTLNVSKEKYVSESFEFVVDKRVENIDLSLYQIGDVSKDGKVNALDKVDVSKRIKSSAKVDRYSDINGDGKVNALDKVAITKIIKGIFDFS